MANGSRIDLSHAFSGANADDYRLSRFLMVGALHDKQRLLSQNDESLLRLSLNVLHRWQIPVTEDLDDVRAKHASPSRESVRIINILPEHGGEDFLRSEEKGDVVVLCNIARDVGDDLIYARGNMAYLSTPESLRAAFTSSPDHRDIKSWQKQIEKCEAKIVMVTNIDGFELSELNNGNFVSICFSAYGGESKSEGMLVRRDYLSDLEDYLTVESFQRGYESPLLSVIREVDKDPDTRFSYQYNNNRARRLPGQQLG